MRLRIAGITTIVAIAFALLLVGAYPKEAGAQTAPLLGGAESFAVLGGSTVTNTGTTNVYGDLGVNPGTAVTGFETVDAGPGIVHGAIYTGTDGEAVSARSGVTAAYSNLAGQACTEPGGNLTGQDLGGLTLIEGVYCFDTSAGMTGTLTLDGQGNPGAVFIIRTGSTLTTASGASVNLINGADACNVFWQVGSSATLGTTTSFVGNILAAQSITLTTGATVIGRVLAGTGAVTMDSNIVNASPCSATPTSIPATATTVAGATATAIAQATSTAIAAATLTAVPPATATAIAQATSTAIAAATLTAVPPATATAIARATSTAIAAATLTPVPPATATAIAQATSTAIAAATLTPTMAVPGAPSTGSGAPTEASPPLAYVVIVGAVLLLVGAGGFAALSARRDRRRPPLA
jgi:hypothetical protein